MSGGSLDYAYAEVNTAIEEIEKVVNPLYKAFADHLKLVSKALHDVEWVMSGDYGQGDELESIKAVLGEHWREITIDSALEQIERLTDEMIKAVGK